jgi:6-pyruvoyltetrahydropterin/6-carboxytetrahydropterin synthase
MRLRKTFRFEAAHWLPMVAEDHKCRRMHGHSYVVEVYVEGPVRDDGMVVDFAVLSGVAKPLIAALDHRTLNDIDGLDNPTSENLARWLWERLSPELEGLLVQLVVSETADSACIYEGD